MKRLLMIFLLFGLLLFSSCSKVKMIGAITEFSINDSLSYGNGEKIRVVLLYGQSNATGCTNNAYLQENNPDIYDKVNKGLNDVYINYCCENGGNSSNNNFVSSIKFSNSNFRLKK